MSSQFSPVALCFPSGVPMIPIERCSKPLLIDDYRGFYCPMHWGYHNPLYIFIYGNPYSQTSIVLHGINVRVLSTHVGMGEHLSFPTNWGDEHS